MKIYPLDSPPKHAGIYAIINRLTREIYIGKSVNMQRRYQEWRAIVSSGFGHKNIRFMEAAKGNGRDWDFHILYEAGDATHEELDSFEARAITKALQRDPSKVLNALLPAAPKAGRGLTAPKSRITMGGQQVNYSAAARVLSCEVHHLQKRLMNYRKRGVYDNRLEDLLAATEEHRAKNPRPEKPNVTLGLP